MMTTYTTLIVVNKVKIGAFYIRITIILVMTLEVRFCAIAIVQLYADALTICHDQKL